jgi:hypothetical protein
MVDGGKGARAQGTETYPATEPTLPSVHHTNIKVIIMATKKKKMKKKSK